MGSMSDYLIDVTNGLADKVQSQYPDLRHREARWALQDAIEAWILDNDLLTGEPLTVPARVVHTAKMAVLSYTPQRTPSLWRRIVATIERASRALAKAIGGVS